MIDVRVFNRQLVNPLAKGDLTMKPVKLPISRKRGGLQPGVDLSKSTALLELMEQRPKPAKAP